MINKLKGFVFGVAFTLLLTSSLAMAQGIYKNIQAVENGVMIKINGQIVNQTNYLINNTTYVPLRVVSESLGEKVNWDGNTKTVSIGNSPSQPQQQSQSHPYLIEISGQKPWIWHNITDGHWDYNAFSLEDKKLFDEKIVRQMSEFESRSVKSFDSQKHIATVTLSEEQYNFYKSLPYRNFQLGILDTLINKSPIMKTTEQRLEWEEAKQNISSVTLELVYNGQVVLQYHYLGNNDLTQDLNIK